MCERSAGTPCGLPTCAAPVPSCSHLWLFCCPCHASNRRPVRLHDTCCRPPVTTECEGAWLPPLPPACPRSLIVTSCGRTVICHSSSNLTSHSVRPSRVPPRVLPARVLDPWLDREDRSALCARALSERHVTSVIPHYSSHTQRQHEPESRSEKAGEQKSEDARFGTVAVWTVDHVRRPRRREPATRCSDAAAPQSRTESTHGPRARAEPERL